MGVPKITNRPLIKLIESFWQWKILWVATTAAFGLLALLYVLFLKQDMWVASQGLIVRDEANGAVMRLGRFESQTAMKAAQETVVEMARNPQVISEALIAVGRDRGAFGWGSSEKPSAKEVEELADKVEVRAPKGAEFGTTEVIYLDVEQNSRKRSTELNKAICDALEKRLKQVRHTRANGVITELLAARAAASANLKKATERLQLMEAEIGNDLSDLRGLTDALSNGTATRQSLDGVARELRLAELELQQVKVDLSTARESFEDPKQLLQTPTKLVNSQPGLKRLREGLAAAAIASSQLAAKYTATHPLVLAAIETEDRIRGQLRNELGTSVQTLTKDLEIAEARVSQLQNQKSSLESRIAKLASVRADYGNVAAEVSARNAQLQEAERELAAAEAARDAAETSSLITRLDKPVLGENPVGPGRSVILVGSSAAGLFFGFGLVFLLAPVDGGTVYGRRNQDFDAALGRRASDRVGASSNATAGATVSATPGANAKPSSQASEAPATPSPELNQRVNTTEPTPQPETTRQAGGYDVPSSFAELERQLPVATASAAANAGVVPAEQAGVAGSTTPTDAETESSSGDDDSIRAAQEVIAAALKCNFSSDADAAPPKA
ncbi:MAG: Wzz/FepE/Etk N-terminal domain-containing protein [Planctomycetota bacterium]